MIHPFLYIVLVNNITKSANWDEILKALKRNKSDYITVASIPVEKETTNKDKEEQILNWWGEVEQASIDMSLEYDQMVHLDITNCYGSIYTHAIPWAIHTKEFAKQNTSKRYIGNKIDFLIRSMQYNQTNGIPQGSVVMDFIAEIVLSYADKLFDESIRDYQLDFKIIRYRDDYKIFSNSKETLETVVRKLNDILMKLNFKLNSNKTLFSNDIILTSIKKGKLEYTELVSSLYTQTVRGKHFKVGLQKHLALLLKFSIDYPNSGSIIRGLSDFYKWRLEKEYKKSKDINQLIAITVDIMMRNFRTVPICVLILSKLLSFSSREEKSEKIEKIIKKVKKAPNVDYINIWLQRLTITDNRNLEFDTSLCNLVSQSSSSLFDSTWIDKALNDTDLIDEKVIKELAPVISTEEILLFNKYND
ncbi:RNA-directed DNA polymerase [Staphylococcus simulans]